MDIISTQNPRVKQVVKLQQNARERKETGHFVVEGVRECSIALQSGYIPHEVYTCCEIYNPDPIYPIPLLGFSNEIKFQVTSDVYAKMSYRSGAEGILIVFCAKYLNLNDLKVNDNSLFLVIEKVEKPGNLGAIFRTADAAGVSAILVCDPACDPYNPNAIRSSLGCIFGVPWAISDSPSAIQWLGKKRVTVVSSTPDSLNVYSNADLTGLCAIVMGAEDSGLSKLWLNSSNQTIKIPMLGRIDSLNVSVSAAILLFEAQRQRGIGK